MFTKILIANRGEIACRVIKTARRMGIATVAVYSDADANARHVRLADEAVHIGPAPARESYLVGARIIAAAQGDRRAGDPSRLRLPVRERRRSPSNARAEGIVFIGPPAAAIRAMGSKSAAKTLMAKAGVPLTPGYHGDDQDPGAARARGRQDRLSGADQGERRRRRQGHAPGRPGRGLRRGARLVPARGEERVRRRPRPRRAVRAEAAPHRDPGLRRQPRPLRLPVRARLLGAAAPPEGARGSARARHDRRAPRRDGPGRRRSGARRSATSAPARSSSSPIPTAASISWR